MGTIVINEKHGIVLDPDTLTVGESRSGFYKVNLQPIEEQIDILEDAVEGLFGCLDASSSFSMAQPNREGALSKAGFVTMFFIGLTFGILVIAIVLLTIGGI
jgi:tetrahydromethanopterin S-methyltransferase subunit B